MQSVFNNHGLLEVKEQKKTLKTHIIGDLKLASNFSFKEEALERL